MLVIDFDPNRPRESGQYHVRLIDSESGDYGKDVKHQNQLGYWCDEAHIRSGILRPIQAALHITDEVERDRDAWKAAALIYRRIAPTVTNKRGGSQSHLPYRFDRFDGPAMFRMAEVLHQGAEQYGPDNWRKIDVADHLNHLIAHAYAWIGGDRSDDHLSHIMCRAMFACAVQLTEEGKADG